MFPFQLFFPSVSLWYKKVPIPVLGLFSIYSCHSGAFVWCGAPRIQVSALWGMELNMGQNRYNKKHRFSEFSEKEVLSEKELFFEDKTLCEAPLKETANYLSAKTS